MKRSIILTMFAALTLSLSAQHVTPLGFQLTEFNLDTLRAHYSGSAYLLELQRLDKLLKDDTKALKDAKSQFNAEKEYYKQSIKYVTKAEKIFKDLQTDSQKELTNLNKLKEDTEKQLRLLNSTKLLSSETRSKVVDQLQAQRNGIDTAIAATTSRQSQLANHPVQLQQIHTDLMVFNNELINKETDLKQMESTLKTRRDIIKSETKNVKAQK